MKHECNTNVILTWGEWEIPMQISHNKVTCTHTRDYDKNESGMHQKRAVNEFQIKFDLAHRHIVNMLSNRKVLARNKKESRTQLKNLGNIPITFVSWTQRYRLLLQSLSCSFAWHSSHCLNIILHSCHVILVCIACSIPAMFTIDSP